jgi:hypothetical protein
VKVRLTPRPISSEEAEVVRASIERVHRDGTHAALLRTIGSLMVVGRCECGCASVDFASPVGTGILASALGRTAEGQDVGIIVWGGEDAIRGLEIYWYDELVTQLPSVDSIRAFEEG